MDELFSLIIAEHRRMLFRPRTWGFLASLSVGTLVYALFHLFWGNGFGSGWGFVEEMAAAVPAVTIFAVLMAGGLTLRESNIRNVRWIRSSARAKVLFVQYAAAVGFGLLMQVGLLAAAVLIGGVLYGFGGYAQPAYYLDADGGLREMKMALHALVIFGLQTVPLLMTLTLAFMLSTVLRSAWLAKGLAVGLMLAGNASVYLFGAQDWMKYVLFAHDLQQYFNGPAVVKGMTFTYSLGVIAAYFWAFQLIALLVVGRKQVKRVLLMRWPYSGDERRTS